MSGYGVYTKETIRRDPRKRRAYVWGLLDYADQTEDLYALREARDAIQTIGEGSKSSPRELFEARYTNIADRLVMDDPDTATIVALGRRVLQEPLMATSYMRGGRPQMRRSVCTPETVINFGRICEGAIAHVTTFHDSAGALLTSIGTVPLLIIAEYRGGEPIRGGALPLRSQEGRTEYNITEHTNLAVDPLTIRLFEDEGRAITAKIARRIMDAPVSAAAPPQYNTPEPAPPGIITLASL